MLYILYYYDEYVPNLPISCNQCNNNSRWRGTYCYYPSVRFACLNTLHVKM